MAVITRRAALKAMAVGAIAPGATFAVSRPTLRKVCARYLHTPNGSKGPCVLVTTFEEGYVLGITNGRGASDTLRVQPVTVAGPTYEFGFDGRLLHGSKGATATIECRKAGVLVWRAEVVTFDEGMRRINEE